MEKRERNDVRENQNKGLWKYVVQLGANDKLL